MPKTTVKTEADTILDTIFNRALITTAKNIKIEGDRLIITTREYRNIIYQRSLRNWRAVIDVFVNKGTDPESDKVAVLINHDATDRAISFWEFASDYNINTHRKSREADIADALDTLQRCS